MMALMLLLKVVLSENIIQSSVQTGRSGWISGRRLRHLFAVFGHQRGSIAYKGDEETNIESAEERTRR